MAGRRVRLDAELVRRSVATSRAEAQRLIAEGRVLVDGAPAAKPAALVAPEQAITLADTTPMWASRAAHKLIGALDRFGVEARDRHCLDAGASTGGFTDVLLARGAARVVAVDVGYGQLLWRLRQDPRVVVLDRTNVRTLTPEVVPGPPAGLVVADLSFISLTLVLPALVGVAHADADHLLMVKPQFEAGREHVGRGGVVKNPAAWEAAMSRVVGEGRALGLGLRGAGPSPLPGPSGNVEFFLWLRRGEDAEPAELLIARAVAEGEAVRTGDALPPGAGPADG